jgi:Asp-tRNA(Asn)/Glu-tRNA(Gln) amidotransferase A subunit family amidase
LTDGSALLGGLDGAALQARLRARELGCVELARAFLDACEGDRFRAWAATDPDGLLRRARELERLSAAEREQLPLFGLPVAVKDNFDTSDLPTAYGSPIYAGSRPAADAAAVQRLRAAGAMIAGKTKCAEFAWMFPCDTLNPLASGRTPGGSSSGSAAAVAAGTVPFATGTQTAGSINRPASYCGVVGFKPSFGSLPREGVKLLAPSLDTVGLFARSVTDLELVNRVLLAGSGPLASAPSPPRQPRLAFPRTPLWDQVEPAAQRAIESAMQQLTSSEAKIEEIELPPGYQDLVEAQTTIQLYESAVSLAPELEAASELLSDELREALLEGAAIAPERHRSAKRVAATLGPPLIALLDAYDGVLTPSATGIPPLGLDFTGDPVFCRVWTLIGAPSVSVPVAWTAERLPVGLQVVGAPGRDERTLATAGRLMRLSDER